MVLEAAECLTEHPTPAWGSAGTILIQRACILEIWRELLHLGAGWLPVPGHLPGAYRVVSAVAIVLPGGRPPFPLPGWVPAGVMAATARSTAGCVAAALEQLERYGADTDDDGVHWSGRGAAALLRLAERIGRGRHAPSVVAWQAPSLRPGPLTGLSHLFATCIEGRLHLTAHFGEQRLVGDWLSDALAVYRVMHCLARRAGCMAGPLTLISPHLILEPATGALAELSDACA
jgi:hypothetical protein